MGIRVHSDGLPPLPVNTNDEELTRSNAAHARSMPLARMLDYGMTFADAMRLHRLAAEGVAWVIASEWLGDQNRSRAVTAATQHSRARGFLAASSCYRFAQSALDGDTAERKRIYREVVESFAQGVALLPHPPERLDFETVSGTACGWLFQPPGKASAVVVIFGGADGWREAYFTQSADLLVEGLAVLLLDCPGQGESRLFRNSWLTPDIGLDIAAVAETLRRRFSAVGLWGNSLGGTFAVLAATTGARIDAVCSNSGSARPAEAGERFPRFLDKIAAMAGSSSRSDGERLLVSLEAVDRLPDLTCPILVLHGGADTLFSQAGVQQLHDLCRADDRTMLVWADGEHCLYFHAAERNALVAGWFRSRLREDGATS
jgi:alpha-beta hydrolase superfamily lysophospholipase